MFKAIAVYLIGIILVPVLIVSYQFDMYKSVYICGYLISVFVMLSFLNVRVLNSSGVHNNHVTTIFIIIYALINSPKAIQLFGSLFNGDIQEILLNNTIERYQNEGSMTLLKRISYIVFFVLLDRLINFKYSYRFIVIGFLVFVELAALSRAGIMMALTWAGLNYLRMNSRVLSGKSLITMFKSSLGIFSAGFLFFFATQALRVNSKDYDHLWEILSNKIGSYILAPYFILSERFSALGFKIVDFGTNTFYIIYKLFGSRLPSGVYPSRDTPFGSTVVYTSYYGFLEDYGIIGVALLPFVLFVLVSFSLRMRAGHWCLLFIYPLVYPIISPLIYFNVFVGLLLALLLKSLRI